jgi:hypothetical protein
MVNAAAPVDKGKGSPPRSAGLASLTGTLRRERPPRIIERILEGRDKPRSTTLALCWTGRRVREDQEDSNATATVSCAGQRYEVTTDQALTFGRSSACTICLESADRGISRLAGSVEHESGSWWLHNRSTTRVLVAVDDMGIRTVVAPGRRIAVEGRITVVVEGSVRRHALEVRVGRRKESCQLAPGEVPSGELPTAARGDVLINTLDRLALVALFSGYLERFPRYDPHPKSYADAAALLGWPRTTLVKRIEHLRARLTSAGIPNLVGDDALNHLAEWALTTRVLSRDDLTLIGR